jgi:hypothetical protein
MPKPNLFGRWVRTLPEGTTAATDAALGIKHGKQTRKRRPSFLEVKATKPSRRKRKSRRRKQRGLLEDLQAELATWKWRTPLPLRHPAAPLDEGNGTQIFIDHHPIH